MGPSKSVQPHGVAVRVTRVSPGETPNQPELAQRKKRSGVLCCSQGLKQGNGTSQRGRTVTDTQHGELVRVQKHIKIISLLQLSIFTAAS